MKTHRGEHTNGSNSSSPNSFTSNNQQKQQLSPSFILGQQEMQYNTPNNHILLSDNSFFPLAPRRRISSSNGYWHSNQQRNNTLLSSEPNSYQGINVNSSVSSSSNKNNNNIDNSSAQSSYKYSTPLQSRAIQLLQSNGSHIPRIQSSCPTRIKTSDGKIYSSIPQEPVQEDQINEESQDMEGDNNHSGSRHSLENFEFYSVRNSPLKDNQCVKSQEADSQNEEKEQKEGFVEQASRQDLYELNGGYLLNDGNEVHLVQSQKSFSNPFNQHAILQNSTFQTPNVTNHMRPQDQLQLITSQQKEEIQQGGRLVCNSGRALDLNSSGIRLNDLQTTFDKENSNNYFNYNSSSRRIPTSAQSVGEPSMKRKDILIDSLKDSYKGKKVFDENGKSFSTAGRNTRKNARILWMSQKSSASVQSKDSAQSLKGCAIQEVEGEEDDDEDIELQNQHDDNEDSLQIVDKHQLAKRKKRNNKNSSERIQSKQSKVPLDKPSGNMKASNAARQHIVSIIENRASQVGIAAFNVFTGKVHISQVVDRLTYLHTLSTVNRFNPLELLLSATQQSSHLAHTLMSHFTQTKFTLLKRSLFDETKGEQYLNRKGGNNQLNLDTIYVALAALQALMSYIEVSQEIFLDKNCLQVEMLQIQNVLVMDPRTSLDLELLVDQQDRKEVGSLVSLFNTCTVGGRRLLRSNLLQPLNDLSMIQKRQKAVIELTLNRMHIQTLKFALKQLKDLELIAVKFVHRLRNLEFLQIKSYVIHIAKLFKILKNISSFRIQLEILQLNSDIAVDLKNLLAHNDLEVLKENIKLCIHPSLLESQNLPDISSLVYLMLGNVNDDLGEMERTKYENVRKMAGSLFKDYEESLAGIYRIQLHENATRGFFMSLRCNQQGVNWEEVERVIQEKAIEISDRRGGQCWWFSTYTLAELSNRLKESRLQLLSRIQYIVKPLIEKIQSSLETLFALDAAVSQLDVCTAFAEFFYLKSSQDRPMVLPRMMEANVNQIYFEDLYHPLVKSNGLFQQKHSLFACDVNNVQLVVGRDNSGKSLLLKSIAIAQILAQIGCFVHAKSAAISLRSMILSKFPSTDSLELRQSGFTTQVEQLNFILKSKLDKIEEDNIESDQSTMQICPFANSSSTPAEISIKIHQISYFLQLDRSLILIDEPCNASSQQDNLAVGFGFLEAILEAFPTNIIFCSTKMQEYLDISAPYSNVHVYSLDSKELEQNQNQDRQQQGQDNQITQRKGSDNVAFMHCTRLQKYLETAQTDLKVKDLQFEKVNSKNKELVVQLAGYLCRKLKVDMRQQEEIA